LLTSWEKIKHQGEANMNDKVETINSAHILDCVSHSVSTDGTTAMIVMEVADGVKGKTRRFGLTLPVGKLKWLMGVVHGVAVAVEKQGKAPGSILLRFPEQYSIASSKRAPGHVILQFDVGAPNETNFVFINDDGLNIADALYKDINPRMTMEDRRERQIIKPPRPIIKPGH
jgi:hypothetical protein